MSNAYGWDAAFCPDPVPVDLGDADQVEFAYAGFYLGGSSAFHTWTDVERRRLAASGLKCMPIWVPTPGHENPRQVALEAAAAMLAVGFPPRARPWYRPLMWDLETGTEPDPGWVRTAALTLHQRGYDSLLYGSVDGSHIFAEPLGPGFSGYIVAHYDGIAELYPHPGVVGKQYAANVAVPGGEVDLDVVAGSLLAHLGSIT
jgi:hypothetical protein